MARFSLCFAVCAAVCLVSSFQANIASASGIETWSSSTSATGLLAQRNRPGHSYAPDRASQSNDYSSSNDDSQSVARDAGGFLFRFGKVGVMLIVGGIYWLVKWSLFDD